MQLAELIKFYQELSPQSVIRFPEFYSANAYFKDPFNEVRGLAPIQRIFTHMFTQVGEPRFVVTESIVAENGAMLIWEFNFQLKLWGKRQTQIMRGVSHLRFDADEKVCFHRDYWDTSEELYMKLPAIGTLMRGLRRVMAA
jgi:hypothetical protein